MDTLTSFNERAKRGKFDFPLKIREELLLALKAFSPSLADFGMRDSEKWAMEVVKFAKDKNLTNEDFSAFVIFCCLCKNKDRIISGINSMEPKMREEVKEVTDFLKKFVVSYTSAYRTGVNIPSPIVCSSFPCVNSAVQVWKFYALNKVKPTVEDLVNMPGSLQIYYDEGYKEICINAAKEEWIAITTTRNEQKDRFAEFGNIEGKGKWDPKWTNMQWDDHYWLGGFSTEGNLWLLVPEMDRSGNFKGYKEPRIQTYLEYFGVPFSKSNRSLANSYYRVEKKRDKNKPKFVLATTLWQPKEGSGHLLFVDRNEQGYQSGYESDTTDAKSLLAPSESSSTGQPPLQK